MKAKILDTVESVFHVPARMFDETGRAQYAKGVGYAQSRSRHLFVAVKVYGDAMKHDSPPTDRASRHYWNALDQQSTRLLTLVRDDRSTDTEFGGASPDPWTRAVRAALQNAFDAVCPRLTPRQIEAYAEGLRALSPAPAKPKIAKPRQGDSRGGGRLNLLPAPMSNPTSSPRTSPYADDLPQLVTTLVTVERQP